MQKLTLFVTLLFILFIYAPLHAQELTPQQEKEMNEKYFGNKDLFLGATIDAPGTLPKARTLLKKARDTFEKEKNWEAYIKAIVETLKTYPSDPNYQQALDLAESTLKRMEKEHPEYLKFCDEIYWVTDIIYGQVYQQDKAIEQSKKQIEILEKFYEKDSNWRFGRAYSSFGKGLQLIGKNKEAEQYYFRALKILEESPQDKEEVKENLAQVYENISKTYSIKAEYEDALAYAEMGIEILKAIHGENSKQLIFPYQNLASIYGKLSEKKKQIEYLDQAIYIIETANAPEIWLKEQLLPYLYTNGAIGQLEVDEHDKALEYLNKADVILNKQKGVSPIKLYSVYIKGNTYLAKNNLELSEKWYKKTDSLYLSIKSENESINATFSQIAKGAVYGIATSKKMQYKFEDAKKYLKRTLTEFPAGWQEDIVTYHELADIFYRQSNIDSALHFSNEAVMLGSNSYFPDDELDLPIESELKTFLLNYEILSQRAVLLSEKGLRKSDSSQKNKYLNAALTSIDLADEHHSENLRQINLLRAGESKEMITKSEKPFLTGIDIISKFSLNNTSTDFLEKAFYYTQKKKAQQLWLTLLKSEAKNYGKLDIAILEKEKALLDEINKYENLIFEAKKTADSAAIAKYEGEFLFPAKKSHEELLRNMEKNHPEYYQSKYSFIPESTETIKNLLLSDELLIEYVVSDSSLFIFTISNNSPIELFKAKIDSTLSKKVIGYKEMLQNTSVMRKSSRERFVKLSHDLYQQFLQPIQNQLVGKERLVIIGDGMTSYIPFETLLSSPEVKPFEQLDFLIKKHEASYHYSSTLFAKARRKKSETNSGIYAFAPVYDSDVAGNISGNFRADSTLRATEADGSFAPLPESEREVKFIFKLFNKKSKKANNQLDLRADANEASLKENLEKPYQFVHIAGHSFADVKNPKFSGIACYENLTADSTELAKGNDGTLYTGEIYNISSAADLVTLSSCESGFGKLEKTEGLLGLNRAFIYAGTPNVVFSLWKVYDKVSANLMVDFYKNVLDGKTYSTSLREAKLELLKEKKTAAPHFWSPYLLIGR